MNLPVITAVAARVPDAIPLSRWNEIESALRLVGHPGWDAWMRSWHPDYGHWLEARPCQKTDASLRASQILPAPHSGGTVPVETGTDLSGLAAKVANDICAARARGVRPVDVIMFCHSSLDEHISTTTAGRLCTEVGTSCFPFSVSQQQGASVFTALRLTTDLFVAEPDIHTILIVAAEKWCPPFSRWIEPDIVQGDAAGALLVERGRHGIAGLQLLDAATRQVILNARLPATGVSDGWAATLISIIELLLARHCLRHDDIDELAGHLGIPSLTSAVYDLLGRPDTGLQHQHCAHLGAADPIVRLAHMLSGAAYHRNHRLLLWGFGAGGFVGAALLEARGAPSLHLQDHVGLASCPRISA